MLNLPLEAGFNSAAWRGAITRCVDRVEAFAPQVVVVAAGFDCHAKDPLGAGTLQTADYHWATVELVKVLDNKIIKKSFGLWKVAQKVCAGRVLSVLEGGYDPQADTYFVYSVTLGSIFLTRDMLPRRLRSVCSRM